MPKHIGILAGAIETQKLWHDSNDFVRGGYAAIVDGEGARDAHVVAEAPHDGFDDFGRPLAASEDIDAELVEDAHGVHDVRLQRPVHWFLVLGRRLRRVPGAEFGEFGVFEGVHGSALGGCRAVLGLPGVVRKHDGCEAQEEQG